MVAVIHSKAGYPLGGRHPLSQHRKHKTYSTVYGYLLTLMPILRYLGLSPVKKVQENGLIKYKPYLGKIYMLQIFCECFIVSYLTYDLFINVSKKITNIYTVNAIELFSSIMFAAHVITSKIKTIEYRTQCVESFDVIHEVDLLFKQLGISTSYNKMTFYTRVIAMFFGIIYPFLLTFSYKQKLHFVALLFQIWRFSAINMFGLFIILLYSKYRKLNKFLKLYIKENEEGIILTQTTLQPLEVIDTIANLYDKLCFCGQNWNDMYNSSLSINLMFYSVATTLFAIAYYFSPGEMVTVMPSFIFLFFEFFYVLIVAQITRNERNSFLLQTLHQRVNFTVLHVFPLDCSMAIKIGGIVLSVLVLTIQIRSLEEAQ